MFKDVLDSFCNLSRDEVSNAYMTVEGLKIYSGDMFPQLICPPFETFRLISDSDDRDHILLQFINRNGQKVKLPIRRTELMGTGQRVIHNLIDQGFPIKLSDKSNYLLLKEYLLHLTPEKECQKIHQTGFFKGAFIQPGIALGTDPDTVFLKTDPYTHAHLSQKDSTEQWKLQIASLAHNNPLLIFIISFALTPLLLKVLGIPSFGIHLFGQSSQGKSILGRVCNSVWGDTDRVRSWNMSQAGLEHILRSFQDTLLVLDEISEVPQNLLSRLVYQLGNGITRSLAQSKSESFSLCYFSSGEKSLEGILSESQNQYMEGHRVRMINVPISSGGRYKALDDLHQQSDPGTFMENLDRRCRHAYGSVVLDFIEQLVQKDPSSLIEEFEEYFETFTKQAQISLSDGVKRRVARQFSLCGFAGELATQWNLTGWDDGASTAAVQTIFQSWLTDADNFVFSAKDQINDQLEFFLHNYSDRFVNLDTASENEYVERDIFGFKSVNDQGQNYFILAPVFTQKLIKTANSNKVIDSLIQADVLIVDPKSQKPYKNVRLPHGKESKVRRIYHIIAPNTTATADI